MTGSTHRAQNGRGTIDERGICACGHPAEAHGLVKGFKMTPGVSLVIDNIAYDGVSDVWVCGGGRLVADPENASPWDYVCGCVLHHDPNEGGEQHG